MASEKYKIMSNVGWRFGERLISQGVTFLLTIILARLLMPSEYGLIAMIHVFIYIANVLLVSGFNTSLIQKKDADATDFSTIFYCTLLVSFLIYGIVWFGAPLIASFYGMPELCKLTRVYGLSLIIMSYQTIQQAWVARHMVFKKSFYATTVGAVLSGVLGIIMAYCGFGVWSLVAQYLSNIIFTMLTMMTVVDWKPQLLFSWERAKSLMNYGSKIMISSLVTAIYQQVRQLLIGKFYAPADLALYNRGRHMPEMVRSNVDGTLMSVLFPAISNHSDDLQRVKQLLRRSIKTCTYVTFFCLTLMAVSAKPIVNLLLTAKWIDCVPYMQIMCIAVMIDSIGVFNLQALKAIGKSDEVLKLEIYKRPLFLIVVIISVKISVMAVALTSILNSLYAISVNATPTKRHIGYLHREQVRDLLPAIGLSLAMSAATLPLLWLPMSDIGIMIMQVIVGISVYLSLSIAFRVQAFDDIKAIFIKLLHKKTKSGNSTVI